LLAVESIQHLMLITDLFIGKLICQPAPKLSGYHCPNLLLATRNHRDVVLFGGSRDATANKLFQAKGNILLLWEELLMLALTGSGHGRFTSLPGNSSIVGKFSPTPRLGKSDIQLSTYVEQGVYIYLYSSLLRIFVSHQDVVRLL
jgi:hypothetical protein